MEKTEGPPKNKPTKAERRAMQEKQVAEKAARRAATAATANDAAAPVAERAAAADAPQKAKPTKAVHPPPTAKPGHSLQHDNAKSVRELHKRQITPRTHAHKQVPLFAHLPQYEREASLTAAAVGKSIHPAVLRLGLQLADGVVTGTQARLVGMLRALQTMILDFESPPTKVFSRELEGRLKSHIQYLTDCRPKSLAMGDAIKWLKVRIAQVPPHLEHAAARKLLSEQIDVYIDERVVLADEAIAHSAARQMAPGAGVLIYGSWPVVEQTLMCARALDIDFSVVVVDAGPKPEARGLLARLLRAGVRCTYAMLPALSYLMPEATIDLEHRIRVHKKL